jgi:hypothetical protein
LLYDECFKNHAGTLTVASFDNSAKLNGSI